MGAKPPHGHLGVCRGGGAVAPPQKELFAIAKSGTLDKAGGSEGDTKPL